MSEYYSLKWYHKMYYYADKVNQRSHFHSAAVF